MRARLVVRPKAGTVPANDRLRPDNRNRAKDGGKPAIEPNKQKTIGIVEVRSFRRPSAKHIDLLRRTRISAASFALDLKSEARRSRISLNRSVIRSRAYPVYLLRLCRI